MQNDNRVAIQQVSGGGFHILFYWNWEAQHYGVSVRYNGRFVEESILDQEGIAEPELPGKRLCQAFWQAFLDYANGDDSLAPVFAPQPPSEARAWGRSMMAQLQNKYMPAAGVLALN